MKGKFGVLCFLKHPKCTCGQVLVLPSRRLVRPAADDDFVICFVLDGLLHSPFEIRPFAVLPTYYRRITDELILLAVSYHMK